MPDLAERVAAGHVDLAATSGRQTAVVEGLRCLVYGVDAPWDGQVVAMDEPRTSALAAAREWTLARARGCVVMTRQRHLAHRALVGLGTVHPMPALALRKPSLDVPDVAGVTVGDARDPDEFLAVYGAELAPLVTSADLADPSRTHLVARLDEAPVAVALVRVAGAAAYVSAVTVAPAYRRRGLGTAVSAVATRRAVETGADLVWLHATAESQPIYERLGYRLVDVHAQVS